MSTIRASVLRTELLNDEVSRDGSQYEVFVVLVRKGMQRWQLRRKYQAFVSLDTILLSNFRMEWMIAGIKEPFPETPGEDRREKVDEFLVGLCSSEALLESAPLRQFLEVRSPTTIFRENNPSKSVSSFAVFKVTKSHSSYYSFLTWSEVVLASILAVTCLPVFLPFHVLLVAAQPFCAGFAAVVSCWYLSLKDGLFDFVLEKVTGRLERPAYYLRSPDLPGYWMFLGVLLGLGLGSGMQVAVMAARLAVVLAVINAVFIAAVATNILKVF